MNPSNDTQNGPNHGNGKGSRIHRFLFPAITVPFLLRLCLVAALAYGFFGYLCVPARIRGESMEPNFRSGGFLFVWRPRYWFHAPRRGDVVVVRLAGRGVMYLKRVVALAGDTVAFHDGKLILNEKPQSEPYVAGPCSWELPPRTVSAGHVYVVGDNRRMSMEEHQFGSVPLDRIEGRPLW